MLVYAFVFNHTTSAQSYTLSLHDALPISGRERALLFRGDVEHAKLAVAAFERDPFAVRRELRRMIARGAVRELRSEEHTSELQSRRDLVCRLLLEKKNRRCAHE